MKISDARQLSPDAQEELRRRCVEAVLEGMTQTAAAALFQVARGTVSPRGQTPVVRATGKVFGCNIVSAITNQGHLAFMVYESSFNAATFHEFLTRLLLESPDQKVFLILDNLRVHRAKVLQPWLAQNKDRIELFFLPPYSPDLNPDELLNHDLKANAVGRKRARTKDELIDNATSHLESRKAAPAVISNLFREKHVRYAA